MIKPPDIEDDNWEIIVAAAVADAPTRRMERGQKRSDWPPFRATRFGLIDLSCFGLIDEWHLDFAKAFEHLTFDFVPWPRQAVVPLWPAFRHARLEAVGSVGDAVDYDCAEDLLID